jgi:hypothetical protein
MKYAVETGSDAMMYIPSFITICSGILKLIEGYTDTQTYRQDGDLISLFLFFLCIKIRLNPHVEVV